jgi:transaldolase
MSQLQRLRAEQGQSPWLDNLTRGYLNDGTLARLVADGVRGVTANPTIIARAIESSDEYDEQFASLTRAERSTEEAYWELVVTDVFAACGVLRPVYDSAGGMDGFVSVEVAPVLAGDTQGTILAARRLHQRVDQPNLLVKIPATAAGVPAIKAMVAEGRNINVTLIFSLRRYAEVIEAYLSGLETLVANGGDPAQVHGVASFFVSRVDTEIDHRLEAHGSDSARALRGQTAVAQAKLAYQLFRERFSGDRWERLASHGAHPQLPLWASTSSKNPRYRDTFYVEELIGPQTVATLAESTIAQFEDHGIVSRTVDTGVAEAEDVIRRVTDLGIDLDDVGLTLEDQGIQGFQHSYQGVLDVLADKRHRLGRV